MTFHLLLGVVLGAGVTAAAVAAIKAVQNARRVFAEIVADNVHPIAAPAARGWEQYRRYALARHRPPGPLTRLLCAAAAFRAAWAERGTADLADDGREEVPA